MVQPTRLRGALRFLCSWREDTPKSASSPKQKFCIYPCTTPSVLCVTTTPSPAVTTRATGSRPGVYRLFDKLRCRHVQFGRPERIGSHTPLWQPSGFGFFDFTSRPLDERELWQICYNATNFTTIGVRLPVALRNCPNSLENGLMVRQFRSVFGGWGGISTEG